MANKEITGQKFAKYFFITICFSLLAICCIKANESLYGNWVVEKEIAVGPVAAITEDEIKDFIGKKVVYSDKIAKFDGELLNNPKYLKTTILKDDFLTRERMPLTKLGISEKAVTEIEIYIDNDCASLWDSAGSQIYIKNKDALIIGYGGVYFELSRKK